MIHKIETIPLLLASSSFIALAACGGQAPASQPSRHDQAGAQSQVNAAATATAQKNVAAAKCLGDGAELFEGVTETAASATFAELDRKTAAASAKANECVAYLTARQKTSLEDAITASERYLSERNRTDLALNSVEAYRVLVSAKPRSAGDPPLSVSLLDYAGFRYQAGAAAPVPRWGDMARALDFAKSEWSGLARQVTDEKLATAFSDDLTSMQAAIDAKDAKAASSAVASELDNVDQLEGFFAK